MRLKKTTVSERKYLKYLNELRRVGEINMFGARPFLMDAFKLDKEFASDIMDMWMDNFNEAGSYEIVKTHTK